jgi:circadian clock protein KaiC
MLDVSSKVTLQKSPTGIAGFDEITAGGLPAGRPTLICGAAGSGKTLLGVTFLVNGAKRFDEAGVLVSFEERAVDLAANSASLGYDIGGLVEAGMLVVDHVRYDQADNMETAGFDLEGLFVRLGAAVDSVGAKRIVLDTIESLFSAFKDTLLLRAELRRLFGWIKDRRLTAIITGEQGDGQFTRQGLEEYVSDCVILLDNRVQDQIATRRMRIVKYRGSTHGTNEYPFLIDAAGISMLPLTAYWLNGRVSGEVVSSGIPGLDAMIRSGGFFRGSSILLSGVAGTGKTTVACHYIDAACARGERCLFFVFEESAKEVCRNARSVGLDLEIRIKDGFLRFDESRPSLYGLEMHLARMYRALEQFQPTIVVIDPISAFRGPSAEVRSVLLRMVDLLKGHGITALFTSLRSDGSLLDGTDQGLSSLMDTWIKLMNVEENGERNRLLCVVKSRGSSHSNQVREYSMSDAGIELIDAYIGPAGVLTGTARIIQDAHERAGLERRRQQELQRMRDIGRRRDAIERQIAELLATMQAAEMEEDTLRSETDAREAALRDDRNVVAARRRLVT